jgi:hypothetical protein
VATIQMSVRTCDKWFTLNFTIFTTITHNTYQNTKPSKLINISKQWRVDVTVLWLCQPETHWAKVRSHRYFTELVRQILTDLFTPKMLCYVPNLNWSLHPKNVVLCASGVLSVPKIAIFTSIDWFTAWGNLGSQEPPKMEKQMRCWA